MGITKLRTPRVAETLVSWIWQEGRFAPAGLRTLDGRPLQIVFRGHPGDGSGPDFRDALVVIDGRLCRGDVEIHVRPADWQSHGHSGDPRYRGVVLHVVLEDGPSGARSHGPGELPVLALRSYLDAPLPLLAELARLERPPSAHCCGLLGWPAAASADLLDCLGDDRFSEKVVHAETRAAEWGPDEALHRGILDALGVPRNRTAMREVADRVPYRVLEGFLCGKPADRRVQVAEAMLLGTAGFLPEWGSCLHELTWARYDDGAPPVTGWDLFRIRPSSHPARRLLAYAQVIGRAGEPGLFGSLVAGWPAIGFEGLRRRLTVSGQDPMSVTRAATIVIDVLLPLIAAREVGTVRRDGAAWWAFRTAPRLADNAITRLMTWQLFASSTSPVLDSARRQQGLLHLYRGWCQPRLCAACLVTLGPTVPNAGDHALAPTGG